MAFCTSCGAPLDSKAQFCVKCGTRQALSSPSVPAAVPAPASGGSGALKIVLIVVAGVILLGVIGSVATMIFVGKRLHDAKVSIREHGGEATIETPMGTVHTTKDPEKIAANLGVDIYPGAKAIAGGSEAQVMGMHVVTGVFETNDSPEKVASFYRERFPKAIYTEANGEHTLVSSGRTSHDMTTIHIKEESGRTRLTIVNNSGRGVGAPGAPEPPEPPRARETN